MSGLSVLSSGRGPDLVLVHGWGLNAAVWDGVLAPLAARWRVHRLELPGHGASGSVGVGGLPTAGAHLADWADRALAALPELTGSAVWIGWSLGGMLALQAAAAQPAGIRAVVCIAAAPRFSAAPDWPEGMSPAALDDFAGALAADYTGTLTRFLALQTRGSTAARETLRQLRDALFTRGEPDPVALGVGLEILRSADVRPRLPISSLPVLFLGGERDTLASAAALRRAAAEIPGARLALIPGAGHAPFLSHPQVFLDHLEPFLEHVRIRTAD